MLGWNYRSSAGSEVILCRKDAHVEWVFIYQVKILIFSSVRSLKVDRENFATFYKKQNQSLKKFQKPTIYIFFGIKTHDLPEGKYNTDRKALLPEEDEFSLATVIVVFYLTANPTFWTIFYVIV